MRPVLLTMMMLSLCTPAFAVEASDTMQAWKRSSQKERAELLEQILGKKDAASDKLMNCMDETSKTPGHADLQIGDVAKVCASAGNPDQPV